MIERFSQHPAHVQKMDTQELRNEFAITGLMESGKANFVYSHYDRMIIGGISPASESLQLNNYDPLKSEYFLERREIGIINIGGNGTVTADGQEYSLEKIDCLYLGKGTKEVSFANVDVSQPAMFYVLSAPAHQAYPNRLMKKSEATAAEMGSSETSNERTIYKYIHLDGIRSCQLVMGLTMLKKGSVWNTMPAHTHNRRMEAYLYFDLDAEQRVFHFMGEPTETRHLLLSNHDAVISPPWSIHSGCGTGNYSFIWGMAGENQAFSDMDAIVIKDLR